MLSHAGHQNNWGIYGDSVAETRLIADSDVKLLNIDGSSPPVRRLRSVRTDRLEYNVDRAFGRGLV